MRVEVLSDHLARVQHQEEAARRVRNAQRLSNYNAALCVARRPLTEAAKDLDAAWHQSRYHAVPGWAARWIWRWLNEIRPQAPHYEVAGIADARRAAGMRGEARVIEALGAELDDGWLALRGFWTPWSNEVDIVLVGPSGVYCIEVKSYVGLIRVNGDRWTRTFLDGNGRPKSAEELMVDGTGRSPSQQVRRASGPVRRAIGNVPLSTWVILACPESIFWASKHASNITVDWIATLDCLWSVSFDHLQARSMSPRIQSRIEQAIREAHVVEGVRGETHGLYSSR